MDEIAVQVTRVSKDFRLPHEKTSSIKNLFINALGAVRKRRSYEVQHALKDISLEIKKGEFFGIVGRNGSGKSTLLKMLAGIYQPTKGTLQVKGKLVPFIELGVGFNPELTGRENVYLNGALLGFSKEQVDAMYAEIVEFAEIEKFMDQKLKNYSSGMQVRLAFSMAIRAKADVLLIDEVLAVGDADFQRKCFDYFHELKKTDTTVVFVTHNMDAIREYCERAVLIEDSKLVMTGSAKDIATQYSRMFTEKDSLPGSPRAKQKRWGDGKLLIKTPKFKLSNNKKKIIIEGVIHANATSEEPILGFALKGPSGQVITGTNTVILEQAVGNIPKNQQVKFSFEMENILNDGIHSIDLALIDEDGITVNDWWEDAVSIRINKEHITPYLVSPETTLTIRGKE